MRIWLFAGKTLHQCSLPRSSAADEEELQLKQWTPLLVARLEIVTKDFFGTPAQDTVG